MNARGSTAIAMSLVATACETPPIATPLGMPPDARPPASSVPMQKLQAWDYTDGLRGMPDELLALSGQQVVLEGMLIPMAGAEALLCARGTRFSTCDGPDVHQLVRLTLPVTSTVPWAERLVRVQGTFHVGATVLDGYCDDFVYQLRVEHLDLVR